MSIFPSVTGTKGAFRSTLTKVNMLVTSMSLNPLPFVFTFYFGNFRRSHNSKEKSLMTFHVPMTCGTRTYLPYVLSDWSSDYFGGDVREILSI